MGDGNTVDLDFLLMVGSLAFPEKEHLLSSFYGYCAVSFSSSERLIPVDGFVAQARNHHLHVIEEFGEDCFYHSGTKGSVSYINWI